MKKISKAIISLLSLGFLCSCGVDVPETPNTVVDKNENQNNSGSGDENENNNNSNNNQNDDNTGDSGNTGGNQSSDNTNSDNTGGNNDSGNTGGNTNSGDSGNTDSGNNGDSGNTSGDSGDSGNTGGNDSGDSGNVGGDSNDDDNTGDVPDIEFVAVKYVTLNAYTLNLIEGESSQLIPTISPSDATNKNVTYSSNNVSVATVENGLVTAVSKGTATIKVKTEDGDKIASCTVIVEEKDDTPIDTTIHVSNVSVDTKELELLIDTSETITCTVLPDNAENKNVTWSTTDETVATVKDGVVTAVGQGTCSIVCKSEDGDKKDFCTVTVKIPRTIIKATITDSKGLLKYSPELEIDGKYETFEPLEDESGNNYVFLYGKNVKLSLTNNSIYDPVGVTVNGKTYYVNSDNQVVFPAVCADDVNKLNISILYRSNGTAGEYTFEVEQNEFVDVKFFNENMVQIDSADAHTRVYVSGVGKEGYETYKCVEVTYKYVESDIGTVSTKKASYDSKSGLFYFDCPASNFKKIVTVSISAKDTDLLDGTTLQGKYVCVWLTNATKVISEFQTPTLDISASGTMLYATNEHASAEEEIMSVDKANKTFKVSKNYDNVMYRDNYVFTSTFRDSTFSAPQHNYDLLCFRLDSTADSVEDYSVHGEKFRVGDYDYVVVSFYKNNVKLSTAFIKYDLSGMYPKVDFYDNVNVEILYGNDITDEQVMYKISDASGDLLMVSSELDGGYENRVICEGNQGKYINNDQVLVVYNDTAAFLNDVKYKISFDGNNAVLESRKKTINLTIDVENNTFVIVSEEDTGIDIPTFNCTFKGSILEDEDDDESWATKWELIVNNSDDVITGTFTQNPGKSFYQKFYFTGEYDTSNNSLKLSIYKKECSSSNPSTPIHVETYVRTVNIYCENGKVTVKDNVDYYAYKTKGMVLTCSTFKLK